LPFSGGVIFPTLPRLLFSFPHFFLFILFISKKPKKKFSERERERERRNCLRLRLSRNRLQPPTRPPHSKSSAATIEIVRRHIEIARRFSSVKHSRRFHSFDFKSLFGNLSISFFFFFSICGS
jgi:hypothetical protein